MNERELREKIARRISLSARVDFDLLPESYKARNRMAADQILALIKESGYQTHEEAQGLVDTAMKMSRVGYVKLADDQALPTRANPYPFCESNTAYNLGQEDLVRVGWRKVELKK